MVKFTKNSFVDIDLYEERIQHNGFIYYDRSVLEQKLKELTSDCTTLELMCKDIMLHHSGCQCFTLSKETIIYYLQYYEFCPAHYFITRKTESESLDLKRVIEPLLMNNYAVEFLSCYVEWRKALSRCSSLRSLLKSRVLAKEVSQSGNTLYRLGYNVRRQTNSRFNYSNYDIIAQIPKQVTNCIATPQGKFLAWGDFAQSDFRIAYNLFIRSEETDKIMDKYDDKYEALARIVEQRLHPGQPFDLAKFKEDRKIYKVNTLAVMYGTRNTLKKKDQEFVQMFSRFLETCPKYVEYERRLHDAHALGLNISIKSYFGNDEVSPRQYSESATVDRALNVPIQKGTSEMIILTVNSILDKFYELGYTEEDISIYLVRHDEPVFLMSERAMKDAWIFKEFSKIFVDNWSPLELSFNFGYNYGVDDEDLTKQYEAVCAKNSAKITKIEREVSIETDYFPTKRVRILRVYGEKLENETIVSIVDERELLAYTMIVDSISDDEIAVAVCNKINSCTNGDEYKGIIVYNPWVDCENFAQNSGYVVYRKSFGTEYQKVINYTRYAVCCYCKKLGKESPVEQPLSSFEEFIKSLQRLEIFK